MRFSALRQIDVVIKKLTSDPDKVRQVTVVRDTIGLSRDQVADRSRTDAAFSRRSPLAVRILDCRCPQKVLIDGTPFRMIEVVARSIDRRDG